MVAYSFQRRFAEPILAGAKRQTIRADRKRHARPGELVQLYVGMRTKACRKIIPDPVCTAIEPVRLCFSSAGKLSELPQVGDRLIGPRGWAAFARADGFESMEDMAAFWLAEHGAGAVNFEGVLIRWEPR